MRLAAEVKLDNRILLRSQVKTGLIVILKYSCLISHTVSVYQQSTILVISARVMYVRCVYY
jgi:hypothetical protein